MSSQPRPSIRELIREPLWADRLSITTICPGRSSGARTLLYVGFEDLASGGSLYRHRRAHPQVGHARERSVGGALVHEHTKRASRPSPERLAPARRLSRTRLSQTHPPSFFWAEAHPPQEPT